MNVYFVELKRNFSGLQYVRAGMEAGYHMTLLTYSIEKYAPIMLLGRPLLSFFDAVHQIDTTSLDAVSQKVVSEHQKLPVSAVIGTMDMEMLRPAQVSRIIGLRSISEECIALTRDKYAMRKRLRESGIEQLRFQKASSLEQSMEAVHTVGLPFVIKPVNGFGSCDVSLISSAADLRSFYSREINLMKSYNWRSNYAYDEYICEEFVDGELFSVDLLVFDGTLTKLGVIDRILSKLPYFAEVRATFPVDLGPEIDIFLQSIVSAVEFDFGIAHIEVMKTATGYSLIDFNPRMPGSFVSMMIGECLGIDLHAVVLNMFGGIAPPMLNEPKGCAMLYAIVAPIDGVLTDVRLDREELTSFGAIEIHPVKRIGEKVSGRPTNNEDSVMELTFFAKDRISLFNGVKAALSTIMLEIDGKTYRPATYVKDSDPISLGDQDL